jgi:phage portal protein BeeE
LEFHDDGRATINGQPVNRDDLIRFDGPNEGLLARASQSVRNSLALEQAAANFAHSPIPAIELHSTSQDNTLTQDKINALVQSWVEARNSGSGAVAYTPSSIEVKTHGSAPENLLIAGRNYQAIDAARFLGIPADILDASPDKTNFTYANVSQRAQALIDFGLSPFGAAIEARLSMADISPSGTFIKFKYDELTEASDSNPTTPAPMPDTAPTIAPGN